MPPFDFKRASDHDSEICDKAGCIRGAEFAVLGVQFERIDKFLDDAAPLLEYVRAEIERNKRRADFYEKITEHVLGAGIIAGFAIVGSWGLSKLLIILGVK